MAQSRVYTLALKHDRVFWYIQDESRNWGELYLEFGNR